MLPSVVHKVDTSNLPSPELSPDRVPGLNMRAFASTLCRKFNYTYGPGMLRCLFALFAISIPASIICFKLVMHFGHPTSFSPDGSRQGFTAAPKQRGTINLIWSCLSTIFTCVYVSLHLDVSYSEKEPRGWREKALSTLKSVRRKALWIVINIVAPELVAYVAIIESLNARRWRKIIVRHLKITDEEWTLAHQFFAEMGGFKVPVVEKQVPPNPESDGQDNRTSNQGDSEIEMQAPVDTNHAYVHRDDVILRSGYDFYKWSYSNPSAFRSINLKQAGIDIENCSKADWLLKTLTIIQASWLVVQTIVRALEGLAVSELEVTTCAYVACTVFTYGFWWYKPYGVQKHILLHVTPTRRPSLPQATEPTPFNRGKARGPYGMSGDSFNSLELPAVVLSGCIGAVIGAIHCTLWNATFANTNGQLLWRVCSIAQIVAPLIMSFFLALFTLRRSSLPDWVRFTIRDPAEAHRGFLAAAFIPCFVQFLARIVTFILIGYSFWSLPADVYQETDWTWSWYPHFH